MLPNSQITDCVHWHPDAPLLLRYKHDFYPFGSRICWLSQLDLHPKSISRQHLLLVHPQMNPLCAVEQTHSKWNSIHSGAGRPVAILWYKVIVVKAAYTNNTEKRKLVMPFRAGSTIFRIGSTILPCSWLISCFIPNNAKTTIGWSRIVSISKTSNFRRRSTPFKRRQYRYNYGNSCLWFDMLSQHVSGILLGEYLSSKPRRIPLT